MASTLNTIGRVAGGIMGTVLDGYVRTNINGTYIRRTNVTIGATGAPTLSGASSSGFGISRNSTGSYALTFPALPSGITSYVRAGVALSAATTVAQVVVTAYSATGGTATLITALNTAGTPVDPANGDVLWIELVADDLNSP
jgi:hypothetical protein